MKFVFISQEVEAWKRSNIAFLFQKHDETKNVATCAPPIPAVDEGLSTTVVEAPPIVNDESAIIVVDEGTCGEQEETPTETATPTCEWTRFYQKKIHFKRYMSSLCLWLSI